MNHIKTQVCLILLCLFSTIIILGQDINSLKNQVIQYRNEGDFTSEAQALNKLGFKYWEQQSYNEAIESFNRLIEINKNLNNQNGVLVTLSNLGAVCYDAEKYNKAYEAYKEAVTISKSMGKKKQTVINYTNAATSLQGPKRYSESNKLIDEALPLAKELNDLKLLRTCYRILAENYEAMGNSEKAIEHFDLFNTYDRKIKKMQIEQVKEESAVEVSKAHAEKEAKELELKYTVDTLKEVKELTEMQKLEIDVLNKQKQIDELKKEEYERKLEYERKIRNIVVTGFVILLLFSLIIIFQFRQKQKANVLLAKQNDQINLQNKQITDSISYAQTIQRAILPMNESISNYFESFIIFKPKDIVSGDFYWFSCIEENKKWIAAVVDCTGHGVPGAFMSMIGNTLLNTIINEQKIHKPSKILMSLNDDTVEALKQKKNENRDGMDVCLCVIEKIQEGKVKLVYSGAKRSLIYFDSKEKKIKELKADRLSIGGVKKYVKEIKFNDLEMTLNKGDIIYLSSDGFIDQNAPDRKRFGSNRLSDTLNNNATKKLSEQKQVLEDVLSEYMNGEIQRDDITILGLKI